jgi:hypothetical protein
MSKYIRKVKGREGWVLRMSDLPRERQQFWILLDITGYFKQLKATKNKVKVDF